MRQLDRIEEKLDRLLLLMGATLLGEGFIVAELDDLRVQVAINTQVEGSAVTLILGIAAKLEAAIAAGNPVALVALKDELKASADSLASAVSANTAAAG